MHKVAEPRQGDAQKAAPVPLLEHERYLVDGLARIEHDQARVLSPPHVFVRGDAHHRAHHVVADATQQVPQGRTLLVGAFLAHQVNGEGAGRAALLPHPLVEDLPAAMQPAGLALEAFAGKRQHVDAMPLGGLACHLLDVVADEPHGAGGAHGHGLRAIALHRLVERAGQLSLAAEDDVGLVQVRGEHPASEGGTVLFARAPIAVDARKIGAAHRSVRDEQDVLDAAHHEAPAGHVGAPASVEHARNGQEPPCSARRLAGYLFRAHVVCYLKLIWSWLSSDCSWSSVRSTL